MIDAQVDLAARRRLRDEGANSFLVTLAGRDQRAVEGIVTLQASRAKPRMTRFFRSRSPTEATATTIAEFPFSTEGRSGRIRRLQTQARPS